MHDPLRVEKRKPLTPKQRLQLFQDCGGICCICKFPIDPVSEKWIDEHINPLWLTGTNDLDNRGVAHLQCAKVKTAREATERAKSRRVAAKHFGAKKSKRPMMGSKASGWKRKMNGSVIRRDEE